MDKREESSEGEGVAAVDGVRDAVEDEGEVGVGLDGAASVLDAEVGGDVGEAVVAAAEPSADGFWGVPVELSGEGVGVMESDDVLDESGDGEERGPAAEVGSYTALVAGVASGFGEGGRVAFPDGVRVVGAVGLEHGVEDGGGGLRGKVAVSVADESPAAGVGCRYPDGAAPVLAMGGLEHGVVSRQGDPGGLAAEEVWAGDLLRAAVGLWLGGGAGEERPEAGGGADGEMGVGLGVDVVEEAVLLVPVEALDELGLLLMPETPGVGEVLVADECGELGDAVGGQRLLGEGVEPEEGARGVAGLLAGGASARGVVHAAADAAPEVSVGTCAPGGGDAAAGVGFVHGLEPVVVALEDACVVEQMADAVEVAGHVGGLKLGPGEQRRVVGVLDEDGRMGAGDGARPTGLVGGDEDARESRVAVDDVQEVAEGLDAGEDVGRELAEEDHEAGVPDPDARVAERLVHVGVLGHAVDRADVVMGQAPGQVIEFKVAGVGVVDGFGNVEMHERLSLLDGDWGMRRDGDGHNVAQLGRLSSRARSPTPPAPDTPPGPRA